MKNITNDLILKKYASKDVFIRYFRGYSKDVFKIFEFQSGEYIVRQEEPLTYLHLLMEGRCNVQAILPNGKKAILRNFTEPELIGEMEILSDVQSYSVQALQRCFTIALPLPDYQEALLKDAYFLRAVCDDLVRKERSESMKLIHSFTYPLENRQDNTFHIMKVQIAESLGVSERHVGNIMSSFLKTGYLIKNKTAYIIADEKQLLELADEMEKFHSGRKENE